MEVDVPTDNTNEQTPMEIDEDTSERNPKVSGSVKVMASSGTVGSVSISLHPLVIMNVSEHWTRLRAQEGSDQLGKRDSYLIRENSNIDIKIYNLVNSYIEKSINIHFKLDLMHINIQPKYAT